MPHTFSRTARIAVAALLSVSTFSNAQAGVGGLGGATEWTQILNNTELVSLVGSSAEQVQNQITQITQLAEQIRPFLEDAYDYLPAEGNWLPQLASLIRPDLVKLEDAIELAEWAFTDEIRRTDQVTPPEARPILARLVAEIAAVVLLDEQTAVAILNAIQPTSPTAIHPIIEAALTGTIKHSPIPKILGIIGKQRALNRLAATIRY